MRSSGFSWPLMIRPLSLLVVPLAAILLIVELSLAPRASQLADNLLEEALKTSGLMGLQAGRFHVLEDGNLVLYVESVSPDGFALENVFIHRQLEEGEQVWFAAQGRYMTDPDTGARFLALENGQVTEGAPGQLDYRIMSFVRNDVRLPQPEQRQRTAPIASRPSGELLRTATPETRAEFQWRIAPAVTALVLGLLAIPLAHQRPREGRGGRIVLGFLAYAIYANVLYLCRAWIGEGVMPVLPGMWWIHLVVFLIALVWLQRQGRMGRSRTDSVDAGDPS